MRNVRKVGDPAIETTHGTLPVDHLELLLAGDDQLVPEPTSAIVEPTASSTVTPPAPPAPPVRTSRPSGDHKSFKKPLLIIATIFLTITGLVAFMTVKDLGTGTTTHHSTTVKPQAPALKPAPGYDFKLGNVAGKFPAAEPQGKAQSRTNPDPKVNPDPRANPEPKTNVPSGTVAPPAPPVMAPAPKHKATTTTSTQKPAPKPASPPTTQTSDPGTAAGTGTGGSTTGDGSDSQQPSCPSGQVRDPSSSTGCSPDGGTVQGP